MKVIKYDVIFLVIYAAMSVYSEDRIVAEYQSQPIYLSDVRVGLTNVVVEGLSSTQQSTIIRGEARQIKCKLVGMVLESAFQEYHVGNPPEEKVEVALSQKLSEVYGSPSFTDVQANRQNETLSEMVGLLEAWQSDNASGEQLYTNSFSSRITPKYWAMLKEQYATSDELQKLKKRIPRVDAQAVNQYFKKLVIKELKEDSLKTFLVKEEIITDTSKFESWLFEKMSDANVDPEYRPYIFPSKNYIGDDTGSIKEFTIKNKADVRREAVHPTN